MVLGNKEIEFRVLDHHREFRTYHLAQVLLTENECSKCMMIPVQDGL